MSAPSDDMPTACATGKTRLFVEEALAASREVTLSRDQSHYLVTVLRSGVGEPVLLFNGRDGEWRARLVAAEKKGARLYVEHQVRPQDTPADLWLLFAPVKRLRLDFIVQKAVELGVAGIGAVFTHRTNVARVKDERLGANAIEAAEQCGRLSVPEIMEPRKLSAWLEAWPADRRLLYCDEWAADGKAAPMILDALKSEDRGRPWAVLIGPEGGFAPEERSRIAALPGALPVGLGPRIMRADTAAVAALSLWQAALGDWRDDALDPTAHQK